MVSNEITGGGGLQLVYGRPTLALKFDKLTFCNFCQMMHYTDNIDNTPVAYYFRECELICIT